MKLRKEEKSIRDIAQALGIACITTSNVLKKKETGCILSMSETDMKRVDHGKQQQLMTNIVSCEEKTPKHQSVTSQTNSTGQG